MFNAVAVGIILLDGWGMIGIWTDKFGFHNVWEGKRLDIRQSLVSALTPPKYGSTRHSMGSSYALGTVTRKQ